ncbi:MAG: tyrosine-type recombinase/integrase, partial [Gordonia sp. (in: high G+C Gram-positive bacteria)]
TGLRIGEALALRVRDWNAEDGRLLVQRGKTASARRPVFVPDLLRSDLTALAEGCDLDAPIFRAPRGGALSRSQFVKQVDWPKQREMLGRPTLTPHALRHTYASLSRSLTGSDLRKLQAQLGHASASTTLSVYTHLFGDELAEQASLLNGAIEKRRGH